MEQEKLKHFTNATMKMTINTIIGILVVVILLMYQWFVLEDATTQFNSGINYWISKIIQAVATFMLMISSSNIIEERRKAHDKEFNNRLYALDTHYQKIHSEGQIDQLEIFITNINKQTKYNTYIDKVKRKIKKINSKYKDRVVRSKKLEPYEKLLCLSVDEVWDEEQVKFNEITTPLLFSGAVDVPNASNDANDLHNHRGKYSFQKLLWKFVIVVALGIVSGDIVYSFNDFCKEDIVPLLLKIFAILWAVYSGLCFGSFIFEQVEIVLKKKLRILSQFEARVKVGNFDVNPQGDLLVDKARKKYGFEPLKADSTSFTETNEQVIVKDNKNENKPNENALQKTWNESFGEGKLIKPQNFAVNLMKNIIEKDAENKLN